MFWFVRRRYGPDPRRSGPRPSQCRAQRLAVERERRAGDRSTLDRRRWAPCPPGTAWIFRGGWQAGEVEGDATDQSELVGLGLTGTQNPRACEAWPARSDRWSVFAPVGVLVRLAESASVLAGTTRRDQRWPQLMVETCREDRLSARGSIAPFLRSRGGKFGDDGSGGVDPSAASSHRADRARVWNNRLVGLAGDERRPVSPPLKARPWHCRGTDHP